MGVECEHSMHISAFSLGIDYIKIKDKQLISLTSITCLPHAYIFLIFYLTIAINAKTVVHVCLRVKRCEKCSFLQDIHRKSFQVCKSTGNNILVIPGSD